MSMASRATAVAATLSPTHSVDETPTDVSRVTTPAATAGIAVPAAVTSRAYSRNASSRRISATAKNTTGGAYQTTATAIAMSTAPLRTRVIESGRRGRRGRKGRTQRFSSPAPPAFPGLPAFPVSLRGDRDRRRLDAAVATVAFLIGDDGLEQMASPEIGPERLGDPDLGVCNLPEEEVADAHLAARPDEQVGIGLARRVEKLAEAALVEVVGAYAGGDRAARGVDDLCAAAVVERDVEEHAAVAGGFGDPEGQLGAHVGRELVGSAHDLEPDVVLQQRAELEADVALQQRHQRVDFGAGPFPVLDRKRVQRQDVDAEARRRLHDVAHRRDPGPVSLDARQVALRGPASVPVHDDGDVRRQLIEVDLPRQRLVRRSRRDPGQELLKRHERVPWK